MSNQNFRFGPCGTGEHQECSVAFFRDGEPVRCTCVCHRQASIFEKPEGPQPGLFETTIRKAFDMDYPNIRASWVCPLCGGPKDIETIVCWTCYRWHGLRDGMAPEVKRRLDNIEAIPNAGIITQVSDRRRGR